VGPLQKIASMRVLAVLLGVAIGVLVATDGSAQDTTSPPTPRLAPSAPGTAARTGLIDADGVATPAIVARLSEEFDARLRAVEQRFRDDPQLQRAGTVVGLGAVALGALRGKYALTFVGTHALRLGLDQQLTRIRQRSGFAVEPSIGYRTLALRLSRTFD
jgi:hypothetical protein